MLVFIESVPPFDLRVVLMKEGRITADGQKEEILQPERLGALFGVLVEIARRDGYYHMRS